MEQFKAEYGVINTAGDTNSFVGGLAGVEQARSGGVVRQMRYIEGLLNQYQMASGVEKDQLKKQIYSAYKSLNSDFGTALNKYVARAGRGTVRSAQQALKNAGMNKPTNLTNAAKVRPLLDAAKGFKYLSKGLIALGIGKRSNLAVLSTQAYAC